VLVDDGAVHPLSLPDARASRSGGRAPDPAVHDRTWVLAYGSNACPDRLIDKRLDRDAVLLPASAWGWRTVWEARRSLTGAVPLTLVGAPGERLETWVLGLQRSDLDRLDRSEGRGSRYALGRTGDVAVAARWRLPRALAYGPGAATRVLATGTGSPLSCPPFDQRAARAALQHGRRHRTVARLPLPAGDGWPHTPLEPLDLFVYGSLQPGGPYWPRIAADVAVVGPGRVAGTLTDTGRGWPAGALALGEEPDRGGVVGTLLRPADRDAARRLLRTADAIEGEGRLFERVAVRVRDDRGSGWAAAYRWHPDQGPPPGERLADGRWPLDG
jgi:gamma-glutamylcyclotransferase (GGCT)/AIG2-like uncharacterized protein YtfP